MKQLNIIFFALRAVMATAGVMAIYHIFWGVGFLVRGDESEVKNFFSNYFAPFVENVIPGMNKWYGSAFCLLYAALLIYALIGVIRFYNILLKIEEGQLFYHSQGKEFKKAASSIIIFGKAKYLLFCTAALLYFDFTIFATQLPALITLYLLGKLVLLISHITEKGEFIKQENELTI